MLCLLVKGVDKANSERLRRVLRVGFGSWEFDSRSNGEVAKATLALVACPAPLGGHGLAKKRGVLI